MPKATRIGCDNLVYAPVILDDGTTLTCGIPTLLPGVMKLNINPNPSQDTLFCDDGPGDTASTLGKIEVEIDKNALSTAEKGALLGHTLDGKGALVYGANDVPPWVSIGFRTLKSNGMYRYIWLYKGKFMEPEDNNETKKDSINFQSDTIKGQFAKLNKAFIINGKSIKPWKLEIDAEDATADEVTIANWFTSVILPTAGTSAAALTVTVAAGSVSGSTKATITGVATNRFAVGVGTMSAGTVYAGSNPDTTIDPYDSAANITGVLTGYYLRVYDLDAAGKVVKFYAKQLATGDIMA